MPAFARALATLVFPARGCAPSGYSHCVQVRPATDFSGEWLLSTSPVSDRTLRTGECVAQDRLIDRADGPRRGKVRWAECSLGPDCSAAGRF